MPHPPLPPTVIAQQAAAGGGNVFMLVMFAALAVLMFLSFRRARKVQTQQAEMRRSLRPGQEVMTAAGLFGTIVAVDEPAQRATVEIAPGTRVQVHLQGIASVVEPATPGTPEATGATAAHEIADAPGGRRTDHGDAGSADRV